MKRGSSFRWRLLLFPPIGHRVVDRGRGWVHRHLPLANLVYYCGLAWATPRLLALGAIGVAMPLGMLAIGVQNDASIIGFASLAILAAGFGGAWLWRPRLDIHIDMPARIECGQSFALRYTVRNTGKRSAYDVAVDSLPYSNPTELRMQGPRFAFLPPGRICVLDGRGKARRRGRYCLHPFRWDTDFPLGLWRCGKTDWAERFLTVFPAYTRLSSLAIPMGARYRLDTHSARRLTRSALEFHGCREFRAGDSVRHLHPRSSARLGVPVVKEFQAEGRGRTAVVVDTWARIPASVSTLLPNSTVEAALSLAASVIDYLARDDRVLELLVAGPGLYRFESAGRVGYFEEVLDILASVEPIATDPLLKLMPVLVDEIRAIQSVCLILGHWNPYRAALVRELQAWQVGVKIVLISRRGGSSPPDLPPETVRLNAREIRRGEVRVV